MAAVLEEGCNKLQVAWQQGRHPYSMNFHSILCSPERNLPPTSKTEWRHLWRCRFQYCKQRSTWLSGWSVNVKEKVKEPLSASMLVEQLWELMWVAVSLGDSLGSWKSATMISATQVTHEWTLIGAQEVASVKTNYLLLMYIELQVEAQRKSDKSCNCQRRRNHNSLLSYHASKSRSFLRILSEGPMSCCSHPYFAYQDATCYWRRMLV
jgi:hypothetical protein